MTLAPETTDPAMLDGPGILLNMFEEDEDFFGVLELHSSDYLSVARSIDDKEDDSTRKRIGTWYKEVAVCCSIVQGEEDDSRVRSSPPCPCTVLWALDMTTGLTVGFLAYSTTDRHRPKKTSTGKRQGVWLMSQLSSQEVKWRDRQPFLESKGYMLRPRLRPGWAPSWISSGRHYEFFEDSARLPLRRPVSRNDRLRVVIVLMSSV